MVYVTGTSISHAGSGYTSGATVTFDPPITSNVWQAGNAAMLGQLVNYNNNIYHIHNFYNEETQRTKTNHNPYCYYNNIRCINIKFNIINIYVRFNI